MFSAARSSRHQRKADQKTSGFTFYLQPTQEKLHFRINAMSEPADVFADVEGRTHVKVSHGIRASSVRQYQRAITPIYG